MPVTPHDRPIDALRGETVDQLIMNYGHGKLSRDAFERRLDEAPSIPKRTSGCSASRRGISISKRIVNTRRRRRPGRLRHPRRARGGCRRRRRRAHRQRLRRQHPQGRVACAARDPHHQHLRRHGFRLFRCELHGRDDHDHGVLPIRRREHSCARRHAHALEGGRHFGGLDNRASAMPNPNAPLLVVEGIVLFGGIDIRVKKTPKQRLHGVRGSIPPRCSTRRRRALERRCENLGPLAGPWEHFGQARHDAGRDSLCPPIAALRRSNGYRGRRSKAFLERCAKTCRRD